MAVDNARSQALLRKLDKALSRPRKRDGQMLTPEAVHRMRTTARRLEAVLNTLSDSGRRERKLGKRLKRLRRLAGGVRDVDVQIAALRKLKIGREQQRKARLMQRLAEQRADSERQLAKALARKPTRKIRKALRGWFAEAVAAGKAPAGEGAAMRGFDAVRESLRQFSALSRQAGALTPDTLHGFRTRCKRIRYVAELAGETPAAKAVVAQLKRIQDAAGDWHDWKTLTETAESLFSSPVDSALVAALRNITNAKFVEARGVCAESRRALLAQHREMLAKRRVQRAPAPPSRRRRKRAARPAAKAAAQAQPQSPGKAPAAPVGMVAVGVA